MAVLVLLTDASTNPAPVSATSRINLHPAPSEVADLKRAASVNVAFANAAHENRDALADASVSLDLAPRSPTSVMTSRRPRAA